MGSTKVFETANPLETVFGQFIPNMEHSLLVNIDELSKNDTKAVFNRLKNIVTATKIHINKKNCPQYDINSYHRYIFTTNSEDPLPTSKDDRRFCIIRCSDEKIGDREYFNNLYKLLDDPNTMRAMYDYFMNMRDLINLKNLPVTDFQQNLKESYEPPIVKWLRDEITMNAFPNHIEFTKENDEDFIIKENVADLYKSYSNFCKKLKLDYSDNVIKFSLKLNNSGINGVSEVKKGKACNYRLINISELVRHFEFSVVEEETEYPSMLKDEVDEEP